jgi:UDP-N-acetylmuramoyl-tripeptide--D-alanyl-D-alanine ligase
MACALGSNPEYVLAAIHNLEPVDNRLQIQKEGEILYLKDAYNSNPFGFAGALEVMSSLPGQRRILVTPGMIELGNQQKAQNEKIGRMAGQFCDFAIIVGTTNKDALTQGLRAGGMTEQNIAFCQTREFAFSYLQSILNVGDIVLIENDLTDLYELSPRF